MDTYPTITDSPGDISETVYFGGKCAGMKQTLSLVCPTSELQMPVLQNSKMEYKTPCDKDSFASIKRSGRIKLTDYDHNSVTVENFIAGRSESIVNWDYPYCGRKPVWSYGHHFLKGTYRRQGMKDYWTNRFGGRLLTGHFTSQDVFKQITPDEKDILNELIVKMVIKHKASYDALTEIIESRDTLNTILTLAQAVLNPVKTFYKIQQHYRKALKRGIATKTMADDFSSHWLQFTYAVKPIMSSVKELTDIYTQTTYKYDETKTSRNISLDSSTRPNFNEEEDHDITCIYYSTEGDRLYRAFIKSAYADGMVRTVDRIQLDPLITTWELIPYSFVVNWFLDIGEWLQYHNAIKPDLSIQRVACYSIRDKFLVTANLLNNRKRTYVWPCNFSEPYKHIDIAKSDEILERTTYNYYRRRVIQDLGAYSKFPSFKMDLSLSRDISGLSLITQKFTRNLRSYKT